MGTLTYHGHSCFELAFNGTKLIIDPFLTDNPKADITPDRLTDIEWIFLTHGHGDHVGDALAIAKQHHATVVAPYELANYCQANGCEKVHPMHIGGGFQFPFGRVKMVIAIHGGGVDADETGRYTTIPSGYIFDADGTRVYHAGDTALTLDMKLLEGQVDVMLVPIGDNFTMGPDDAARAVEFVKPAVTVPIHYGTWDIIGVDPHDFERAVGKTARVLIMQPGDTHTW